jgi:hypothetical protein
MFFKNLTRALPLVAASVLLLSATSASAVTFNGTFTVDLHTSSGAGGTQFNTVSGASFSSPNLNLGDTSGSVTLFTLKIKENIHDLADDEIPNPISVNFNVAGVGTGSITGTTTGDIDYSSTYDRVLVNWNAPLVFDIGGNEFQIALIDQIIECGSGNQCKNKTGNILAVFSYKASAAEYVPEDPSVSESPLPGALPLFASGLGAIGVFGWRRKKKAASNVTR